MLMLRALLAPQGMLIVQERTLGRAWTQGSALARELPWMRPRLTLWTRMAVLATKHRVPCTAMGGAARLPTAGAAHGGGGREGGEARGGTGVEGVAAGGEAGAEGVRMAVYVT